MGPVKRILIARRDAEALAGKEVQIIDATCPFVKKAQEYARSLSREGYAVSYIEAGVPILTSLSDLKESTGIRKVGIVAQTTQSFENLMEFVSVALKRIPNRNRLGTFPGHAFGDLLRGGDGGRLDTRVDHRGTGRPDPCDLAGRKDSGFLLSMIG